MALNIQRLSPSERRQALEDILDDSIHKLSEIISTDKKGGSGHAWTNLQNAQVALQRLAEHEKTQAERAAGVSRYAWMSGFDPSLLVYGSQSAPVPHGDA